MYIAYQLNSDLARQVRIQLKQWPTRTACTRTAISESLCSASYPVERKIRLNRYLLRSESWNDLIILQLIENEINIQTKTKWVESLYPVIANNLSPYASLMYPGSIYVKNTRKVVYFGFYNFLIRQTDCANPRSKLVNQDLRLSS